MLAQPVSRMGQDDHRIDYQPLDETKRQIRVLRLLPSQFHARNPQGILYTTTLNEANFTAISHRWLDQEIRRPMKINGHWITVGPNIHSALRHVRHSLSELNFWLDTICIDQSDVRERGHQVSFMAEIFKKASSIILRTGVTSSVITSAFTTIRKRGEEMGVKPYELLRSQIVKIGDNSLSKTESELCWDHVVSFLKEDIWKR